MIDTLFFTLQIVGIAVLIGWALVNDRLKDGMPSRGPLAFKHQGSDMSSAGQRRDHHARPKKPGMRSRPWKGTAG